MHEEATRRISLSAPSPSQFSPTRLARRVLDVLLPPQCLACSIMVDQPGALCCDCWGKINFLGPPQCAACGLTFEYDPGEGVLCGPCTQQYPVFRRARAAMRYDDASRGLILSFKHGDRTDMAPAFGRWMVRTGKELIADADLLVPVPLHWGRLFSRRYNQAAMLCGEVGRLTGLDVSPDTLVRIRPTPPQGKLSPTARQANIRGAFRVKKSRASGIRGLRILLIDDVMTTGATVSACAGELLKAGAGAVDVLTMARVSRIASDA